MGCCIFHCCHPGGCDWLNKAAIVCGPPNNFPLATQCGFLGRSSGLRAPGCRGRSGSSLPYFSWQAEFSLGWWILSAVGMTLITLWLKHCAAEWHAETSLTLRRASLHTSFAVLVARITFPALNSGISLWWIPGQEFYYLKKVPFPRGSLLGVHFYFVQKDWRGSRWTSGFPELRGLLVIAELDKGGL